MAISDTTTTPSGGNPLPISFEARANAALLIAPDHANGLIIARLAAEPGAHAVLAPEVALDMALRLVAAVNALRRAP